MNNQTWSSKEILFPGVWVYRNVLNKIDIIDEMENFLNTNQSDYTWQEATVGYIEKRLDYRDCSDFKIGEIENPKNQDEVKLNGIWKSMYDLQKPAADDYCSAHHIEMKYWEVMNLIKYGPNQHFQEHADHGFSYSSTVSMVGYLNDDYIGGSLYFPKLNLEINPKKGDLYFFPSTYLFSHIAKKIESGIKYSLVTMLDYNNHSHNDEFYRMREELIFKGKNNKNGI